MTLKTCILTKNPCYIKGQKMTGDKPHGIVVHSTGANNKTLKRYVQPLTTDKDYSKIIADIGKNAYGNHWNGKASGDVCVHAFIGVNATGKVETYQTLPWTMCCWGCGKGGKGSYNYNPPCVQFEICEDGLTDAAYFNAVFKEAIELCAYLCGTYGISPDKIRSHAEAHKDGYASNHGDCDHWLRKHGKNMEWFRAEVANKLNTASEGKGKNIMYRVQVGAFIFKIGAENTVKKLKNKGFDAVIVKSGLYYKVQAGAYKDKTNAANAVKKLKTAGFTAIIADA